jgi:hypothetical protein
VQVVCEVDFVQTFNARTSGWVRVHGRPNFELAWGEWKPSSLREVRSCRAHSIADRLNGGVFGNRSIIAAHNATEIMKIRQPVIEAVEPASYRGDEAPRALRAATVRGPWDSISPATLPPSLDSSYGCVRLRSCKSTLRA